MKNTFIYQEEEFDTKQLLEDKYPNTYMKYTKKVLDAKKVVIGRKYYFIDYTQNQLDRINKVTISPRRRIAQISDRFKAIDIKRFKFIDGELSSTDYEPFRQEVKALRIEYNELEAKILAEGS